MKRSVLSFSLMIVSASFAFGQTQPGKTNGGSTDSAAPPAVAITAESTPADLAKAAFLSMGGEKFRSVQNMILRGSVNLFQPNSVQSIPGGFSIVTAGEKLRMEIDARPIVVFKQIYNGQQSYSSLPGVEMPPQTRFGWGVLIKYDQPGYKVTTIAADKKKQRGFRIEDPEGYTTDFYIDAATGRVLSFLLYYNGNTLGTEIKKFKEVEGVLVPFNFSQRFEMPQGAFFAEFSVKEAKLNQTLGEDAFVIPN